MKRKRCVAAATGVCLQGNHPLGAAVSLGRLGLHRSIACT